MATGTHVITPKHDKGETSECTNVIERYAA